MTPGPLSGKVVTERSEWVREMLERIHSLELATEEEFTADSRNVDAAESRLRRALEALLDLGRHVLAKGFGDAPAEYKEVAARLGERGVLAKEDAQVFEWMAGYRNRLVPFCDRISEKELYEICTRHLGDMERVLGAIQRWVQDHPEMIDREL
jgi:uncharacterized protein YutE (UPF0331/DUF86 family)